MATSTAWSPLASVHCLVDADPRLVRQLMGGVVTQASGDLAGHRYTRVELLSPSEALVRFELRILGRDATTVERVSVDGEYLAFTQVSGFLPAVEETIQATPAGSKTRLSYRGRYQPRPGPWGRTLGAILVRGIYRQEAKKTLDALRVASERRQASSAAFRRAP